MKFKCLMRVPNFLHLLVRFSWILTQVSHTEDRQSPKSQIQRVHSSHRPLQPAKHITQCSFVIVSQRYFTSQSIRFQKCKFWTQNRSIWTLKQVQMIFKNFHLNGLEKLYEETQYHPFLTMFPSKIFAILRAFGSKNANFGPKISPFGPLNRSK